MAYIQNFKSKALSGLEGKAPKDNMNVDNDAFFSGDENPTSKASPPDLDFMNLVASDNKDNVFVFSESDDESKGKRIRTYSFDPENYEPGPGGVEAGTGHVPYAPSRKKKFKGNQLPPHFLNKLALHFKEEEGSSI